MKLLLSIIALLGKLKPVVDIISKLLKRKGKIELTPVPKKTASIFLPTGVFEGSRNWRYIIIHHSFSKDGVMRNFDQLKKYHMSYRVNFEIVTKEEYYDRKRKKDGYSFQKPYSDIGYHLGIEYIGNQLEIVAGRLLSKSGAHCIGMNSKAIGICMVGNFDRDIPSPAHYWLLASLIRHLQREFNIPLRNVVGHNMYSNKTCPGSNFNINHLKDVILGK